MPVHRSIPVKFGKRPGQQHMQAEGSQTTARPSMVQLPDADSLTDIKWVPNRFTGS